MVNNFFDTYSGLLHDKHFLPSENGILFLTYLLSLGGEVPKEVLARETRTPFECSMWNDKGKTRYQANPPEHGKHFSFDNMLGLYSYAIMTNNLEGLEKLPKYYWNRRLWLRPQEIITFNILKRDWDEWAIKLLYPFCKVSMMKDKKHTSGRLLWILRAMMIYKVRGNNELLLYIQECVIKLL